MLGEYKVSRCSRQCFAEQRPLREGESYHSVVIAKGDDYERRDYSDGAWEGPPEGTVGHWKNRMPVAGEKKMVLAPREVLIDLLRQMESMPEREQTRYLLALILLRRRFVKLAPPPGVHDFSSGSNPPDTDDGGEEDASWLDLELDDGSTVRVRECQITKREAETLNESLQELLYCEASEEPQ
jgi:hypothetical protein